jgi:hypothetical protein
LHTSPQSRSSMKLYFKTFTPLDEIVLSASQWGNYY